MGTIPETNSQFAPENRKKYTPKERGSSFIPLKINMSPKKGPSQNQKEISSSNHQFSREMLDFGRVEVFPSLKNPLVSRRFERLPVPLRLTKTEELEDLHRSEVFHLRSMVALSGSNLPSRSLTVPAPEKLPPSPIGKDRLIDHQFSGVFRC